MKKFKNTGSAQLWKFDCLYLIERGLEVGRGIILLLLLLLFFFFFFLFFSILQAHRARLNLVLFAAFLPAAVLEGKKEKIWTIENWKVKKLKV